ncbi:hypothetical protein HBI67_014630 [Parastagonospora nodorum]|nr:hypothetical protein HBI66_050460 [Parastagonospora nodorum]KAH6086496.1 hypothetical protein HBI67_014630 [Parastagonospora nodorum]
MVDELETTLLDDEVEPVEDNEPVVLDGDDSAELADEEEGEEYEPIVLAVEVTFALLVDEKDAVPLLDNEEVPALLRVLFTEAELTVLLNDEDGPVLVDEEVVPLIVLEEPIVAEPDELALSVELALLLAEVIVAELLTEELPEDVSDDKLLVDEILLKVPLEDVELDGMMTVLDGQGHAGPVVSVLVNVAVICVRI